MRESSIRNIISIKEMNNLAKKALLCCLDYISQNTVYSPWTKEEAGWQEQWLQSKITGLYATCNALTLLAFYKDRYFEIINKASKELMFYFDTSIDYSNCESDTNDERQRKDRCRILLEQNCHTTLKAIYFLRAIEVLENQKVLVFENSRIIESVYNQVEASFCINSGQFAPALGNLSDTSVLTTMQAYILMKNKWEVGSTKSQKVKELLFSYIRDYKDYLIEERGIKRNKFEKYIIKKNFVAAFYALSHSSECLSNEENEIITNTFFLSMNDRDIRDGFLIKDSYSVPDTVLARDTYSADSRLLYLKSILRLIITKKIPDSSIEFFLDDFVEIINTSILKNQYMSWDSAPSFSHNIRGLNILHDLTHILDYIEQDHTFYWVSPHLIGIDHRTIEPLNVALFMSFSKEYTESVQETVHEVLNYLGFNIWWATNDPYDSLVVESIIDRLSKAQFVIVDCSERSANVMYEAGLACGIGKHMLLCGCSENVFPYEDSTLFDSCIFESDGEKNPPPYRDLQKGILFFIENNINSFCLTDFQKSVILGKAKCFVTEYLN